MTPCKNCPFVDYEMHDTCLPTPFEIVQQKQLTGNNWVCHANPRVTCRGLLLDNKERNLGLDFTTGVHVGEGFGPWTRFDSQGNREAIQPHPSPLTYDEYLNQLTAK